MNGRNYLAQLNLVLLTLANLTLAEVPLFVPEIGVGQMI